MISNTRPLRIGSGGLPANYLLVIIPQAQAVNRCVETFLGGQEAQNVVLMLYKPSTPGCEQLSEQSLYGRVNGLPRLHLNIGARTGLYA